MKLLLATVAGVAVIALLLRPRLHRSYARGRTRAAAARSADPVLRLLATRRADQPMSRAEAQALALALDANRRQFSPGRREAP